MTEKPSRNEEEYFARQEAELLEARRAKAAEEEAAAERKTHHMRCPKCGHDLATEEYHGLEVDRCTSCDGVWFDAGEVEQLIEDDQDGMLSSVFGAIVRGVRSKKSTSTQ
ncbi:MAG: zf-TFIIB domain-containing protein [Dehalococcoidia bacterium]